MLIPGVIAGWSVKDILAHLAEWEQLFLRCYEASQRGEIPEVPAPGLTWKDIDRFNQQIYQKHCARPLPDIQADYQLVHQQFVERLQSLSEEELSVPGFYPWTGSAALGTWMSAYAAHDRWAKTHIRRWVKARRALPSSARVIDPDPHA
jgi:hypothetical protein